MALGLCSSHFRYSESEPDMELGKVSPIQKTPYFPLELGDLHTAVPHFHGRWVELRIKTLRKTIVTEMQGAEYVTL